jgi:methylenetetrahydrofolate dehydrogenase (NADP+)/methenyltetrahydrofolate cyclohydrolase
MVLLDGMKSLNGNELAGFIKQRQAHEVRRLIQSAHIQPKLAIIQVNDIPVINTYVRLKQRYGRDIGVETEIYKIDQSDIFKIIETLNEDDNIHGIIVQLPLSDVSQTEQALNAVAIKKDVDGLAANSKFIPAAPTAINWLLAGYNIDLKNKDILIIGQGKLVGAPLLKLFESSGYRVMAADKKVGDLKELTLKAEVIVTATGEPGLVTSEMVKPGTVLVDAGTSSSKGVVKGDLAADIYDREDLIVTPVKGGVGPLTVCALFENVLLAARDSSKN